METPEERLVTYALIRAHVVAEGVAPVLQQGADGIAELAPEESDVWSRRVDV